MLIHDFYEVPPKHLHIYSKPFPMNHTAVSGIKSILGSIFEEQRLVGRMLVKIKHHVVLCK